MRTAFFSLISALVAMQEKKVASDDEARTKRLAEQRAALEAQLAATEKFGRCDELLVKVKALADAHERVEGEVQTYPVSDGSLDYCAIEQYAVWNTPRPKRELPLALDFVFTNHPFNAIVDLNRQLREHGKDFVFVVIPTRMEVYPELLLGTPPAEGFVGSDLGTVKFLLELNKAGVETLSLAPVLAAARGELGKPDGDELFVRTDPHWRPRASDLGATEVAKWLAELPWFAHGPDLEGRDFTLAPTRFTYGETDELAARGCIAEEVVGTSVLVRGEPVKAVKPTSRIVVMGDSFSMVFRQHGTGFCPSLLRYTGHYVDLYWAPGGAIRASRMKLAELKPQEWAPKKAVIWLMSSRSIRPSDLWDPLPIFKQ